MDEILKAIESQRWYFFENNDKIIFDRDTAAIWANLAYFPYGKGDDSYSHVNSYAEVRTLLDETNAQKFGGCSDWKIPTPTELWIMIEDQTFPYKEGACWRIKNNYYWCVDNDGLTSKDLDDFGAFEDISGARGVFVIPCSYALMPEHYFAAPHEVLEIFIANNLVPKFNDAAINAIFVEYAASLGKNPPPQTFDFQSLLKSFDLKTVAQSPQNYYAAVQKLTSEILKILPDNDEVSEIHARSNEFFARLEEINRKGNIFSKLAAKETLDADFNERPSFQYLAEHLARIVSSAKGISAP